MRINKIMVLAIVLGSLSSCQIRLITAYDAVSDDLVMSFSSDVTSLFENLERADLTGACEYLEYVDLYARLNSTLRLIEMRNRSRVNNKVIQRNVELLGGLLKRFEQDHREEDCISSVFASAFYNQYEEVLVEIMRLEQLRKYQNSSRASRSHLKYLESKSN